MSSRAAGRPGGLHREHDAAQSDRFAAQPSRLHSRSLGCWRHRMHRHRDHRSGRGQARRSRNQLLHTGNQTSRFRSPDWRIPTSRQPILGRRRRIGLVADSATANYNGIVASVNHRLSSTFNLFANWTWSKCLNIEDAQGDLASTQLRIPTTPAWITARAAPTTGTSSTRRWWQRALHPVSTSLRKPSSMAGSWRRSSASERLPFTVTAGADDSLTDVGNDRPNLVAGMNPYAEVKFQKGTGAVKPGLPQPGCLPAHLPEL